MKFPPATACPGARPTKSTFRRRLVFEAELALAKAQLATQSPNCALPPEPTAPPPPPPATNDGSLVPDQPAQNGDTLVPGGSGAKRRMHSRGSNKPRSSKRPISKSIKPRCRHPLCRVLLIRTA